MYRRLLLPFTINAKISAKLVSCQGREEKLFSTSVDQSVDRLKKQKARPKTGLLLQLFWAY
jgi:hypothetical protein